MLSKSTLLHLRIPFSFFLMPVFLFSISVAQSFHWLDIVLAFLAIHLFLYPASNGYNSYYDKDEGSIGGLEKPPPVDKSLWNAAILFDGLAILLGWFVSPLFALAMFVYGLISKAYSYDKIRLKKYPIASWLVVGSFQGFFIFMAVQEGIGNENLVQLLRWEILFPAILSSMMLLGSYPMTQIYQHEEDGKRGDLTLSRLLGIRGTFIFTMLFFGVAMAGFFTYYFNFQTTYHALALLGCTSPVLLYFFRWFFSVLKDEKNADFRSTMRLNFISAICFNTFFLWCFLVQFFG